MQSSLVIINVSRVGLRFLSKATKPPISCNTPAKPAPACVKDVPGLSAKCVLPKNGPLGPGASATAEYKVPEYFCYDKTSYAEAELEMANFRCPQPTANRKQ